MWYGLIAVSLQVYVGIYGGNKFWQYMNSKYSVAISTWETNLYVALQATALLLLPALALASLFKLGNLANDGYRLGRHLDLEMDLDLPRFKSRDPLISSGSACGAAWRHSPPLAPSLHAVSALCSLVAKLVLEARLVKDGIIRRDEIWNTDLDFVLLPWLWGQSGSSVLAQAAPFPCPEFLSYVLALLAFIARSSDVYWGANKCLAFLMSLQLTANALHALLAFCGASILYKVELVGVPASISGASGGSLADYLLLDPPITVMLLMLLSLTLLLACCPLSMYALNKLSAFIMRTRKRYMRELPAARSYLWSFYPHLAALATLLACAACAAPILHDLSRLYKFNPQPILLPAVTGSIVHAFLWVALWLVLTAKTHWDFRLKVSVGRMLMKSPSCLALAAQVELNTKRSQQSEESQQLLEEGGTTSSPILVLAGGKAYSILDGAVQQKIEQLVVTQAVVSTDEEHHQVYWLRGGANLPSPVESPPPPSTPPTLPDPSQCSRQSAAAPLNISHSPVPSTTVPVSVMSPILTRPVRKPLMRIPTEEDGDYATLRDLPLVTLPEEPADMHETSSSSDSSGVDSGFGSGSHRPVVATPVQSPRLLTRDLCNPYGYVKPKLTTFAAPGYSNTFHHPSAQHLSSPHSVQLASPFHSLPLGLRPINSHVKSQAHSVMVHCPMEQRRPAMQACLLAGHGLETSSQQQHQQHQQHHQQQLHHH